MKYWQNICKLIVTAIFVAMPMTTQAKPQAETIEFSEQEFASEVITVLAVIAPGVEYEYDAAQNQLNSKDGNQVDAGPEIIYLGNMYNIAKHMQPDERAQYLQTILSTSTENLNAQEFQSALMLRVRTPDGLGLRNLILKSEDIEDAKIGAAYVYLGGLQLELILDGELSIQTVDKEGLADYNISPTEALQFARSNVKGTSTSNLWALVTNNIWVSTPNDDYDAARLVLLYPDLKTPVKGRLIAFMPSHSICLITDSDDPKVLQKMVDHGYELAKNHRPLSSALWQKNGDKWQTYLPARQHASYPIAKMQIVQESLSLYTEQQGVLEALFEKQGKEIFVASLMAFENEGVAHTVSIILLGFNVYLPKTDDIAIVDPDLGEEGELIGRLSWDEFITAVGPSVLTPVPDMLPIRYEFKGTLTAKQVSAIRRASSLAEE